MKPKRGLSIFEQIDPKKRVNSDLISVGLSKIPSGFNTVLNSDYRKR